MAGPPGPERDSQGCSQPHAPGSPRGPTPDPFPGPPTKGLGFQRPFATVCWAPVFPPSAPSSGPPGAPTPVWTRLGTWPAPLGAGASHGALGQERSISLSPQGQEPVPLLSGGWGTASQDRGTCRPAVNLLPGLRAAGLRGRPGDQKLPWRESGHTEVTHRRSPQRPALPAAPLGPPAGALALIPPGPGPCSLTWGHQQFLSPSTARGGRGDKHHNASDKWGARGRLHLLAFLGGSTGPHPREGLSGARRAAGTLGLHAPKAGQGEPRGLGRRERAAGQSWSSEACSVDREKAGLSRQGPPTWEEGLFACFQKAAEAPGRPWGPWRGGRRAGVLSHAGVSLCCRGAGSGPLGVGTRRSRGICRAKAGRQGRSSPSRGL